MYAVAAIKINVITIILFIALQAQVRILLYHNKVILSFG
jgi:hypothetical protein